MKVGRNDPCPCGSGRKYKNCCLVRTEGEPVSPALGLPTAILWLEQHHRRAFTRAFDDFYSDAGLSEDQLDRLSRLSAGLKSMVVVNATEWIFAEGEIEIRGERRPTAELVLGRGGPPLASESRLWLEGLARHPLGLYEVLEAVPGEGVWIQDATAAKAQGRWVIEHTASRSLVRWEILGARLVPVGEEWHFSGALYPIPRDELHGLLAALRAAKRAGVGPSARIIACWLQHLTAPPPPLPELVDAGSGDPLLMITDRYEVRDWKELGAALAKQSDVQGDRENGWVRLERVAGASHDRVKLSLNPRQGKLEIFARTRRRAEEGAAWLQRISGGSLTYVTREILDPAQVFRDETAAAPAPPSIPLPPDFLEEHYRNWLEEPIPVLNHLTPREALRTRAGRRKVIELLKEIELQDQRSARAEGREPIRWDFLWEELGIAPPP